MLLLNPPHQIRGFKGPPDTLAEMVRAAQGPRGEKSMLVRSVTERVVGRIWPKYYLGEIIAINAWVSEHVLYLNDPMHVELLKDPQRMCEEVLERGIARGDCDDIAVLIATMALQLGKHAQFVVAGFGAPGSYSHVFARVLDPRSGEWIVCDPVAGSEVGAMLDRITTYQVWSCDELPSHGPIEVR